MSGNISRDAAVRAIMAQKWESGSDGAAALAIVAGAPAAEMQTLAERDAALEKLWEEFGDVPMNPETECMEAPFLSFPAGTFREDIWHWFDERHSKGVAYLMYGGSEPSLDNTALWKALGEHWGHNVRIVKYGDLDDPADICLECDDCGLVILDAELYTLQARDDKEG